MVRYTGIACLFALLALTRAVLASDRVPDASNLESPYLRCDFSVEDSPIADLYITDDRLETAHFRLPADYVESTGFRDGQTRSAVSIRVYIEDFSPYPHREWRSPERRAMFRRIGHVDDVVMLLRSFVSPDQGNVMNIMFNGAFGTRFEAYPDEKTALSRHELKPSSVEGLMTSATHEPLQKRAYVALAGKGDITDVIQCSQPGTVPFPNCQHEMIVPPFAVRATYSQVHIDDWKSIRTKVERLMACTLESWSWKEGQGK